MSSSYIINVSYVLNNNVLELFTRKSFNTTDKVLSYLEFQGNHYLGLDFAGYNETERSLITDAKARFFEEKQKLVNEMLSQEGNAINVTTQGREAEAANIPDYLPFVSLNRQDGNPGQFSVGLDNYWCTGTNYRVLSIRLSNSKQDDIVCISDGSISFTSMMHNGFPESYLVSPLVVDVNGNIVEDISVNHYLKDSIFFGDFDGDGKLNEFGIALADGFLLYQIVKHPSQPKQYQIIRHTTQKNLFCWHTRSWGYSITRLGIKVGDINGDGKEDIWCHDQNGFHALGLNNNGLKGQWQDVPLTLGGNPNHPNFGWCANGYLYIADFNGDNKKDLFCATNSKTFYFLYSAGDGRFYSTSGLGDGLLDLSARVSTWYNDDVTRLTVNDFDGDGYVDIWYNYGYNYFLFGDRAKVFRSVLNDQTGFTSLSAGLIGSWCTGRVIAGDFNGDGKADIWCNQVRNYMLLSGTSYVNRVDNPRLNLEIKDITLQPINIHNPTTKITVQNKICDNRVRPDDRLTCEMKFHNLKTQVTDITNLDTWQKTTTGSDLTTEAVANFVATISGNIKYDFNSQDVATTFYSKTGISETVAIQKSGIIKASELFNAINQNTTGIIFKAFDDSTTSNLIDSISVAVKSGECIKVVSKSLYITDVKVPYTAQVLVKGYSNNQKLSGDLLCSLVKQETKIPVSINPEDSSEAQFNLVGEISMDLLVDSNSFAVNC